MTVSDVVSSSGDPDQVTVSKANVGSQTVALKSLEQETFYTKIRPLAVFNKVFGTFPIVNVLQRDGKLLKHKWICIWQVYDVLLCVAVLLLFYFSSVLLLNQMKNEENQDDKQMLQFWLGATFYTSAIRAVITFFVSHFYAHKYPELIGAVEEYHSGIGALIVRNKTQTTFQKVGPIVATIILLVGLEATSYMYFSQFTEVDLTAIPVGISFLFLYMWKELPLNMMICILMHLISRFDEVRDAVREVRKRNEKDSSCELECHRLQYAALMNIVSLLEKCYGLQLAINMLFLIIETIATLFIFIVVSKGRNFFLLDLSVYNFCAAGLFIFFMDRIERKSEYVLEELSAFDLNSKSRSHQMQVQMFVSQVKARPLKFSASGFCVINNSLIGSLFGQIATYLIVLIQFAPYVLEAAGSDSTKGCDNSTLISKNQYYYIVPNVHH